MQTSRNNTQQKPPRWSLNTIYPGLGSREYKQEKDELIRMCRDAEAMMERGIDGKRTVKQWLTRAIELLNSLRGRFETLYAYAYANYSTDTTDAEASGEIGSLEEAALPLKRIETAFRNHLKSMQDEIEELIGSDPELISYQLFLQEELLFQGHQMSPALEDLAADLSRSGGDAWSRLQSTIASTLSVAWPETDSDGRKTVTELRALGFSPDRAVREKAFRLELEAWQSMEIPISYALNGVKGFSHTLNRRRNYADTLERSMIQSRVSPEALDALIGAMEGALPAFQKYLKRKARLIGVDKLAFYDLFAPVVDRSDGDPDAGWSFETAGEFILKHFEAFSGELSAFTRQAFESGWIDAEPRAGKVGGAYCISFPEREESRVLANFSGSVRSVSTLAHELGHAYHHHLVRKLSPIHQDYPMTLAETASIFAETLVTEKALDELSGSARLELLESSLQDSTQVIVDILSRFYFEQELMQRRGDHELTPQELCGIMEDAQRRTYGESMDSEALHPYMWAVKGHYYRQDLGFYNFPYAFGLLFGIALYGEYRRSGEKFIPEYQRILTETGRTGAVELARSAGFDIEDKKFWEQGLAVISRQIDQFCAETET